VSLGWGIIGTGGFAGSATAPAIKALGSEGSLVAVVSRDRGRAEAFAKQHGAKRAYTAYADLLRDPRSISSTSRRRTPSTPNRPSRRRAPAGTCCAKSRLP